MRFIYNWKFRTQLKAGFIAIIVFIFLTIMLIMHFVLRGSYIEQENVILQTHSKQIASNIENRLEYYMSYLTLLSGDSHLHRMMASDDYQKVTAMFNEITAEFMDLNAGRIKAIRLYRSGIYMRHDGLNNIESVFSELMMNYLPHYDSYIITGTYLNKRNEKVFSVIKPLHQPNTSRNYFVEMCIYETELFSFINENSSVDRISLIHNGMLMSMSDRESFSRSLYQSKAGKLDGFPVERLSHSPDNVQIAANGHMGFSIIIEIGMEYITRGYTAMLTRLIPIMGAVMLVSFLFVQIISVQLQRRLSVLQLKIAALSRGKLQSDLHIRGKDEFAILSDELDNTRRQILSLIQKNNDANELQRVAEMAALRAQINSHFLFNSLSSIKWLSKHGNDVSLSEAVDSLAFFLRYSLSLKENQVALENEIHQLEAYIYLQKLRYGDEIRFHIDVDEQLMRCKTVKLVIQPLFENAIYHGRREDGAPLNIALYSEMEHDHFDLIVEDNGNGMTPQRIRDIYDEKVVTSQSSYGLQNVISRVRLCSNGRGRVIIQSQLDKYTKITIRQPF